MASIVERRKCKCGQRYKTKIQKGRDTKCCPACQKDNTPAAR